jgi:hypothetical protein
LNSGPLEEQLVLLTAEPSLQPLNKSLKKKKSEGTLRLAVCQQHFRFSEMPYFKE